MASYLITGTSRGIGLELTKQLLAESSDKVGKVITVNRSNSSKALNDLIAAHPGRAFSVIAEITKQESVRKAIGDVESIVGNAGLDVLVNNAGAQAHTNKMEEVSPELLSEAFNINVNSVQIMTTAFLPLLQQGKEKKVINVSSTLGSITFAREWQTPTHSYRVSKAALNMLNALYACEHRDDGFTFLTLSPGWLKTDLGSSYANLEPEVGVAEVKRIIFEANPSLNGKFVNIRVPGWEDNGLDVYDGGEIPY